jgi:hypothetical protein
MILEGKGEKLRVPKSEIEKLRDTSDSFLVLSCIDTPTIRGENAIAPSQMEAILLSLGSSRHIPELLVKLVSESRSSTVIWLKLGFTQRKSAKRKILNCFICVLFKHQKYENKLKNTLFRVY